MPDALTVACPAKINLALSVGAPDDSGYHPIASWMVRIDFADTLEARRLDETEPSTFDIGWAADAPAPSPIDWPVHEDLACLACQWVEHYTARALPVAVTLRKRIPVGAGLAGGSANAAAMIDALDRLFELQLDESDRLRIGAKIGSDIPFFFGDPSALVSGYGERLEAAPLAQPIHLALITPPLHCATGAVYRAFDDLNPDAQVNEPAVRRLLDAPLAPESPFNDLAEAACIVTPELKVAREACAQAAGRPVHVTGSGAAMFVVAEDAADAKKLAQRVAEETGVSVRPVSTL